MEQAIREAVQHLVENKNNAAVQQGRGWVHMFHQSDRSNEIPGRVQAYLGELRWSGLLAEYELTSSVWTDVPIVQRMARLDCINLATSVSRRARQYLARRAPRLDVRRAAKSGVADCDLGWEALCAGAEAE